MDPAQLLQVASLLCDRKAKGSLKQAKIRRSIATAYYATFHFILSAIANETIGASRRGTFSYDRAYRAIDHKSIKSICEQIKSPQKCNGAIGSSPASAPLMNIAERFFELYEARRSADYDLDSGPFEWSDAILAISRAAQVMSNQPLVDPDEWKRFLIAIAFKPRKD